MSNMLDCIASSDMVAEDIKILPLAYGFQFPKKGTPNSAGYDIFAPADVELHYGRQIIKAGFALEMPEQIAVDVRCRSGHSVKGFLVYDENGNEVRIDADVILGLCDEDYRGEIGVILNVRDKRLKKRLLRFKKHQYFIHKGQSIAQMKFCKVPEIKLVGVTKLSNTERGTGGFGHTTDKK